MSAFSMADRCWIVAGLTIHGLTANEIAHKMWCCVRQVKAIRAEDLYQVCLLMQREARHFTDEVRLVRSELSVAARTLSEVEAERDRLREQRDRLLTARMSGAPLCGKGLHPMTPYNTYTEPGTGAKRCRECKRQRVADCRARRRNSTNIAV